MLDDSKGIVVLKRCNRFSSSGLPAACLSPSLPLLLFSIEICSKFQMKIKRSFREELPPARRKKIQQVLSLPTGTCRGNPPSRFGKLQGKLAEKLLTRVISRLSTLLAKIQMKSEIQLEIFSTPKRKSFSNFKFKFIFTGLRP